MIMKTASTLSSGSFKWRGTDLHLRKTSLTTSLLNTSVPMVSVSVPVPSCTS